MGDISRHLRGINIQRPWARLILNGRKRVEARKYDLNGYLNEDLWIIETKGREMNGKKSPIIGIVRFGSSFQYKDFDDWHRDRDRHCIPTGSRFDWQPDRGCMYGWNVTSTQALVGPQEGPDKKGLVGCKAVTRFVELECQTA